MVRFFYVTWWEPETRDEFLRVWRGVGLEQGEKDNFPYLFFFSVRQPQGISQSACLKISQGFPKVPASKFDSLNPFLTVVSAET